MENGSDLLQVPEKAIKCGFAQFVQLILIQAGLSLGNKMKNFKLPSKITLY